MTIDGKLLKRAKRKLENKRRAREAELEQRARDVYAKVPEMEELDTQIRENMLTFIGAAFGSPSQLRTEEIRERNTELHRKRRSLLAGAGFREDYLDDKYMCDLCGDTGYVTDSISGRQGDICVCLKKLYSAEKRTSLSSLLKLGNESFENFSLSYYDDSPVPGTGTSPRQHMEIVYDTCVNYARKFNNKSMNLLLSGSTGLGKTFLSACIARIVSDMDYSVVYDMAGSVFSKFEDAKFSKVDDLEDTRDEINRYLKCDLLIIDDLGIEMKTAFIDEALYEVINTRLITNKKTIINTNLTKDGLRQRYSPQIISRLDGEYQELKFYGDDIRLKIKKENFE